MSLCIPHPETFIPGEISYIYDKNELEVKGTNAYGHLGWFEVYCSICDRTLRLGIDVVYKCPKCEKNIGHISVKPIREG